MSEIGVLVWRDSAGWHLIQDSEEINAKVTETWLNEFYATNETNRGIMLLALRKDYDIEEDEGAV